MTCVATQQQQQQQQQNAIFKENVNLRN